MPFGKVHAVTSRPFTNPTEVDAMRDLFKMPLVCFVHDRSVVCGRGGVLCIQSIIHTRTLPISMLDFLSAWFFYAELLNTRECEQSSTMFTYMNLHGNAGGWMMEKLPTTIATTTTTQHGAN